VPTIAQAQGPREVASRVRLDRLAVTLHAIWRDCCQAS
jgi:hypothetical protein